MFSGSVISAIYGKAGVGFPALGLVNKERGGAHTSLKLQGISGNIAE